MNSHQQHQLSQSQSQSQSQTSANNPLKHPGLSLFFIALGLFGLFTVEFSVVGLMPQITARYDVSPATAGLLVSVFAGIVAIFGPAMMLGLSKYTNRTLLVSSLLVFCGCSLLSPWAPNFGTLMLLRVPSALFLSVFFSVAFVSVVSLYPPQQAARASAAVLMGESAGMIFGAPLITLIASTVSYNASFYFCASICAIAAIGLCFSSLPTTPQQAPKITDNLKILKRLPFLLATTSCLTVFAAIYSVYSYTVEYLSKSGYTGEQTSILMMIFGLGGLLGTYLSGRLLSKSVLFALTLYPLLLAFCFALLFYLKHQPMAVMGLICMAWGIAHMGLAVATQFWVTSSGKDAPEFATSIFVSSGNVGVTVGTAAAGGWITVVGIDGAIWSGWTFCIATIVILAIALPGLRRASFTGT